MQEWEYLTHHFDQSKFRELDTILNELGTTGWELVSLTSYSSTDLVAVLKRPKFL